MQCKKPLECNNFNGFSEEELLGTWKCLTEYRISKDSVIISESGKIVIYTNTDSTHFISEGIFDYEILGEPTCYCAGGVDPEKGCLTPTALHYGMGTIVINSTNDSICHPDTLTLNFTTSRYDKDLSIYDGKCIFLSFSSGCITFY
jgi:hypothetical protein